MKQLVQEIKKCPCCHLSFECKVNDIASCQCQSIVVDAKTWGFISKTYEDCLCMGCLLKAGNQNLLAKIS